MSKQPPLAPTASAVGPCPTKIQISRTPWHWKFTKHHHTPTINREQSPKTVGYILDIELLVCNVTTFMLEERLK